MGISINIAIQLARIAPLLKDCKSGVGLTREFDQESLGLRLTDHHHIRQKQAGATWV